MTETATERLPAVEFRWVAHWSCPECYPEPPLTAICGMKLLGVRADPEAPRCEACSDGIEDHIYSHLRGER